MIFIKLDFPAGRWHATAWGSHVNEGIPEWPPCPWRLCRAIIAAWHWKHRRDEATLRNAIEKLATMSPDYFLPEATAAHTRHYMPVIAGPKETKTKVFDTFVHVTTGKSLWIRWDVDVNSDERALLATLLEALNYMGRAESLISATLEENLPREIGADGWTAPAEKKLLADGESVRLLAPSVPGAYSEWVTNQNTAADKKGKGKKKSFALPDSLFSALQFDTADWKKDGWNIPPGAKWIEYLRPRDCFKIAPRTSSPQRRSTLPKVARFAIVSKVPPSITQSLSLAERFHQALCKIADGQNSPTLTGRENDAPIEGNSHVYFLPESDKHGYVTHMTLHAPGGFDEIACRAFGKLRKVWGSEGFDVKIILLATGQPDDFAIASPYFHKAKTWVSLTPFVPVRHPKATRSGVSKIDEKKQLQIGSPQHDCWRLLETLASELGINGDLPVKSVTFADAESSGTRIKYELRDIPCLDFQRNRRTGNGIRAGNRGYSLRIEFENEVSLPFGLGYAAHFGLGLFQPIMSSGAARLDENAVAASTSNHSKL
jgi:CRISPR-associated protein Csb2